MSCISIPIPTIDLSALLPDLHLAIPSPSIGGTLPCCNIGFKVLLDMTVVNTAIALIFAAAAILLAPILSIIAGVVAKIQWALNKLADLLTFNCPLDYIP